MNLPDNIVFDLGGTLKKSGEWEWESDSLNVLRELSKSHNLYIAANQPAVTREFLGKSEENKYIKKCIVSEEIGLQKPDDDFYKYFLTNLGISANNSVYVGDDYEYDVLGPKRNGMMAIWLNTDGAEIPQNAKLYPDLVVRSLKELIPLAG